MSTNLATAKWLEHLRKLGRPASDDDRPHIDLSAHDAPNLTGAILDYLRCRSPSFTHQPLELQIEAAHQFRKTHRVTDSHPARQLKPLPPDRFGVFGRSTMSEPPAPAPQQDTRPVVDLRGAPGSNVTLRIVAALGAQDPSFRQLPWTEQIARASELRATSRIVV